MLVFLQMPVQVGLLPKAAVAQVAFERLLFVVDVPHVPLEVGGDAERPVTVLAPGKQVHLASEERSRAAGQGQTSVSVAVVAIVVPLRSPDYPAGKFSWILGLLP